MKNTTNYPDRDKEIKENLPQNDKNINDPDNKPATEENEEYIGDGVRFEDQPENLKNRHGKIAEENIDPDIDPTTINEILDNDEGYDTRFPAP